MSFSWWTDIFSQDILLQTQNLVSLNYGYFNYGMFNWRYVVFFFFNAQSFAADEIGTLSRKFHFVFVFFVNGFHLGTLS